MSCAAVNYVLPNDELEQDRLDLQHHLFTLTLGGRIYNAPIDEPRISTILDAGTGTGVRAIDMGDKLSHVEVVGIDISPIQPSFVPPNVSFVIDDLELEWADPHPYDFIFGRMLVGSIGDWPNFIRQSFENLKSGGWLELQDIVMLPQCADGTMKEGSSIKKWGDTMLEPCAVLQRYGDSALRYKQQMIDAGFTNVTEVQYRWPTNTWPRDAHDRELGFWSYHNIVGGLSGLSLALFTRSLGWSAYRVEVFLTSVRKEMKDKNVHAWWPIYVVYGQKP
ncbi:uncharacterized protein UV8b_00622 [Ustilaginoidea virens]|uniref:Methyltransferase domain-containing protein n=1 Tax=Ustilaginoidea virens TaxID=1159556 RepID=A0A8E5MDL4_USTVR|nr:uncharacterized protein UV8b_00622 [Ustilaginoidea virens]QUC16381.1 hypothetical protein UV8b_00622 [Ustilaginoidea virens]